MSRKSRNVSERPTSLYWGADVPMRVIRRFARQVAQRFEPERIVLFGSHAYGRPHADSDVDILIVMSARNHHDQAAKIRGAVDAPFPMDLIVRTPQSLAWRLAERESFHTEIMTKGKVLYEKGDSGVATQGGKQAAAVPSRAPPHAGAPPCAAELGTPGNGRRGRALRHCLALHPPHVAEV